MRGTTRDILERLSYWAEIDYDPMASRHAIRAAECLGDDSPWFDRLCWIGRDIGLRINPVLGTVREAIALSRNGRPIVAQDPLTGRWIMIAGGRFGRGKLIGLGDGEKDRSITARELANLVGASSPDEPVQWAITQPLSPAEGLRGPGRDRSQAHGHGAPSSDGHARNGHSTGSHGHGHHHDIGYRELLPRLFSFLKPDWGDVRLVTIFAAAVGILTLATPLAVESLVMTVGFRMLMQQVAVLAILLFAFLSLGAVMFTIQKVVVEYLQRRFFVRIVADLAYRLPRAQLSSVDRGVGQELVNRFFDVMTIQKAFSVLLVDGVSLVLIATFGLMIMAFYHPYLLGFDIVLVGAIIFFVLLLGRQGVVTSVHESVAKYRTAAWLEELARNPMAFKLSGGPDLALLRADDLAKEWLMARRDHFKIVYRQVLFTAFLQVLASTTLLGLGGWLVIRGQLTLGQLVASELIVATIVGSFAKIGKFVENYYDLLAAVGKLGMLIDLPVEHPGDEGHRGLTSGAAVTLRGLGFAHEGGHHEVLHDLNVEITPGERVALLGPTASGKSTLLELLAKAHVPTRGLIELDGMDYRDFRTESLRRQLGMARGIEVIEGTVLENVRMGREDITLSEVRVLLEAVGLWEDLCARPDGIDLPLTPGGAPLSHGQLRRLMLARAMAGGPRLILIDEMLDWIDEHIRLQIADTLLDKAAPWTVIIATRDPEIIARCDRVVALPAHGGLSRDGRTHLAISTTVVSSN